MAASQELNFAIRAVNEAGRQMKDLQGQLKDAGDAGEKASKGLDKFNESGDKGFSVAGKLGTALGDVAKIAGGFVIGQGLMKLPGFLKDAAQGAADDLQATQRLEQSIRNLGGSFDDTLAKVNDAIDAGAKLAFTDDDVRDSFQSLAAATGDADEALKRQRAAMDLARGANIPLATATKMLGKLNEENVEVFKKLGITLGENATETDALAAVQEKFGGQAETFAKGPAGQFEQLKIRIGEAKESLGAALLPVMVKVGDIMAKYVVPTIERLVERFGPGLQSAITSVISVIGNLAKYFGFVASEGDTMNDWLSHLPGWLQPIARIAGEMAVIFKEKVIPALKEFGAKVGAIAQEVGPKLAAGFQFFTEKVIPDLLAAGQRFADYWSGTIQPGIEQFIAWLMPQLQQLGTFIQGEFKKFQGYYETDLKPALDNITLAIGAVVDWFREHWPEIQRIVQPVIDQLVLGLKTFYETVKLALGIIIDLLGGDFSGAWNKTKDLVKGVIDFWVETVKNVASVLKGLAILAATAIWEGLQQVGPKIEQAAEAIKDAIWKQVSALPGLLLTLGGQIISGLINGIQGKLGDLLKKAQDVVDQVMGVFKGVTGFFTSSPSKRTAKEVGEPIIQGIMVGMQRELPTLLAMTSQIAGAVVATFRQGTATASTDTGWGAGGGLVPSTSMPAVLPGGEPGFYDSFGNFIPSAGGAGPDGFAPPNGGAIPVVPLTGGGYAVFVPGVTGGAGDVGTAVPYPGVGTAVPYPGPGSLGGLGPYIANDPTVGTAVPYPGVGTAVAYPGGGGAVIPMLAGGGITRRPTLAYIGEREDEIVAPLSQLGSLMQQAGGPKWGRGAQVVNHFHGFVGNVRELNRQQERAYRRTFRQTGY